MRRSEEEELTFFSVFNQAVAHVVKELGVRSLQVGRGAAVEVPVRVRLQLQHSHQPVRATRPDHAALCPTAPPPPPHTQASSTTTMARSA